MIYLSIYYGGNKIFNNKEHMTKSLTISTDHGTSRGTDFKWFI